jgi:hypothetical protein
MFRPGEPFIEGHLKTTGGIDPFDCLPKGSKRSAMRDTPSVLTKRIAELFETLMAILHLINHRSRPLRYVSRYLTSNSGWRYVAILAVIRVEGQLDVVGTRKHVIYIQAE